MPAKGQSRIAASFDYGSIGVPYGVGYYRSAARPQQVDRQKWRNNYARMSVRDLIATCRRAAEHNWFLRPVLETRAAVHAAGFRMMRARGGDALPNYDFQSLAEDLIAEDLVSSNLVCLWRKGVKNPVVTVLDAERVELRQVGGLEEIRVSFSQDVRMRANLDLRKQYESALGKRMVDCMCHGKELSVIKDDDDEWNFAVLPGGKRRGCLTVPEVVPVLDDLDMIELAKVGDWNLLWKRKDVIRLWKKGYKVTSGQGAGTESVNITSKQVTEIGDGAAKINGPVDIPANHDVTSEYLLISPDELAPKHLEGAIDRLMMFGGIESVVLLGSFSQQNGAAPSLMRNARARAARSRSRVERMLRMILAEEEFAEMGLAADHAVRWSRAPLHSVEELRQLVSGTGDGVASPQTRRDWLDLDNEAEGERHREAQDNWRDYVPIFESSQSLVSAAFPDVYPAAKTGGEGGEGGEGGGGGEPGRPSEAPPA